MVFDVDETILHHEDRDYENAVPCTEVIAKINRLHRAGWRIVLHTSRGMVSCDGSASRAAEERGPVLRDWLARHRVSYDELVFGKPLAVFYVDDRALSPEMFVDMDIEVLKGGSGAKVTRLGNRVIKVCDNWKDQAAWYRDAGRYFPDMVPRVNAAYGGMIDMQYVEGRPYSTCFDGAGIRELVRMVTDEFSVIPPGPTHDVSWDTMLWRIEAHLEAIPSRDRALDEVLTQVRVELRSPWVCDIMEANRSFCHGDLTLENLIHCDHGRVMIDPNRPYGVYSSWLLDLGKIYQSIHSQYELMFSNPTRSMWNAQLEQIFNSVRADLPAEIHRAGLLMEIVHFIRMYKYRKAESRFLVTDKIQHLWAGYCR
jgi:capsule biosynthesis phosphatase